MPDNNQKDCRSGLTWTSVLRQWPRLLLVAGLLLLSTGCQSVEDCSLTARLWQNDSFRSFREPAPHPNLALFAGTNRADVLVLYDELSEKRPAVVRRAYYLQPNQARVAAGKKPCFVKPSAANELVPVPVMPPQTAATNPPAPGTVYAVATGAGREFTLFWSTGIAETEELPVYCETSGTAAKIALTPLAVTGDIVVVTAVVAAVWIAAFVQGGGHYSATL